MSTTSKIVLAEFGRFPLQIQIWQQILRYYHITLALDNTPPVKLAMINSCSLGADQSVTAVNKGWQCHVGSFLAHYSQQLLHKFEIAWFSQSAYCCWSLFWGPICCKD